MSRRSFGAVGSPFQISASLNKMKVTRRRATAEDLEVNLELINQAYKPEGRWKVEERRTNEKELSRLIADQDLHPETQNHQILLVLVADEGEDVSLLPESAQKSRIVAHIRYDKVLLFSVVSKLFPSAPID